MTLLLDQGASDFAAKFATLVDGRRDEEADVRATVAEIVAAVRRSGDTALLELTQRFDRLQLHLKDLRFSAAQIEAARGQCRPDLLAALSLAAARIRAFHERQMPGDSSYVDGTGTGLGLRWRPVDAVGLYVPGGTAAYPSSVLMNAIPARVAGVGRVVMVVPTPDGVVNPLVLAAADLAGVDEIYRVGGAQAVAALAYGTGSIAPVDKIVGPGNAYVAEAKRQVFGRVGIDMIAGPSEIVIVAEAVVDPDWIAADLLSQAEHDERAQAILITDSAAFARQVMGAVDRQLATLERSDIARASWATHGAVVVVEHIEAATGLVDALAPEHLELIGSRAERLVDTIRHAGAIFVGPYTPEVIGDYVGGPNHVLPTGRTARFASGLAVFDFLKRTTLLRCDRAGFAELAPAASLLARAEGLEAHALAVECRLGSAA
ncbi:MAG: histidinol dehydrogenase [Geminicoccaceae bacterium]